MLQITDPDRFSWEASIDDADSRAPAARIPFSETCSTGAVHCVTCSDEAIRGRVLRIASGALAMVEFESALEEVSLELVEAAPGDIVLVHAKVAIARLGHIDETRQATGHSGAHEEASGGN